MSKGNKVKAAALGMSHGTAANRLRKMILFSLVCRLSLNMCYQCGGEILSVNDLSIEHKEPWLRADDPSQSFFNLDNIAFSHLSCNSGAAFSAKKKYHTEDAVRENCNRRCREYRAKLSVEVKKARRRSKYERLGF
jgi:hypothetical protein